MEPLEEEDGNPSGVRTQYLDDTNVSILSRNNSPDVGFEVSLNPYRGCEHGCAYCYARPTHEYLGYSAGLDFETRILCKTRAPILLEEELSQPRYCPKPLALSGVTDPYQPVERRMKITRGCLEVLARFRHPVTIISKNDLVLRDLDLLQILNEHQAVAVTLSITSLDRKLARRLEPRASAPEQRLEAVRALAEAGIPAGVMMGPVIPGLNDTEMAALFAASAEAGARWFRYTVLRLPYAVKDIFVDWLDRHEPGKKERILSRVRSLRHGKLNHSEFGERMRGCGIWAEQFRALHALTAHKIRFQERPAQLRTDAFVPPSGKQLELL